MRPTGRPRGAKNREYDQATASPTRCRCGSTARAPYHRTTREHFAGIDPATGQPYTQIVRRWTVCATCGQARIDRSYEHPESMGNATISPPRPPKSDQPPE